MKRTLCCISFLGLVLLLHLHLSLATSLAGVTKVSPPFLTTENNRFQGYCVDLMNKIKERTHLNYSLYLVEDGYYGPFKSRNLGSLVGMIGDVVGKKADFAIADLTVTEIREAYVNFTEPILTFSLAAIVRKDFAKNLKTLDDLAIKSNLSVGIISGGNTQQQLSKIRLSRTPRWLLDQIAKSSANLMSSEAEALARVRREPFAFLQEEPRNTYHATQDCSLKVLKDPNYYINSRYAIAFRPDSPYLKLFNKAIRQLTAEGYLEMLKQKHFHVGCLRNGTQGGSIDGVVVLFTTLISFIVTFRM